MLFLHVIEVLGLVFSLDVGCLECFNGFLSVFFLGFLVTGREYPGYFIIHSSYSI